MKIVRMGIASLVSEFYNMGKMANQVYASHAQLAGQQTRRDQSAVAAGVKCSNTRANLQPLALAAKSAKRGGILLMSIFRAVLTQI